MPEPGRTLGGPLRCRHPFPCTAISSQLLPTLRENSPRGKAREIYVLASSKLNRSGCHLCQCNAPSGVWVGPRQGVGFLPPPAHLTCSLFLSSLCSASPLSWSRKCYLVREADVGRKNETKTDSDQSHMFLNHFLFL